MSEEIRSEAEKLVKLIIGKGSSDAVSVLVKSAKRSYDEKKLRERLLDEGLDARKVPQLIIGKGSSDAVSVLVKSAKRSYDEKKLRERLLDEGLDARKVPQLIIGKGSSDAVSVLVKSAKRSYDEKKLRERLLDEGLDARKVPQLIIGKGSSDAVSVLVKSAKRSYDEKKLRERLLDEGLDARKVPQLIIGKGSSDAVSVLVKSAKRSYDEKKLRERLLDEGLDARKVPQLIIGKGSSDAVSVLVKSAKRSYDEKKLRERLLDEGLDARKVPQLIIGKGSSDAVSVLVKSAKRSYDEKKLRERLLDEGLDARKVPQLIIGKGSSDAVSVLVKSAKRSYDEKKLRERLLDEGLDARKAADLAAAASAEFLPRWDKSRKRGRKKFEEFPEGTPAPEMPPSFAPSNGAGTEAPPDKVLKLDAKAAEDAMDALKVKQVMAEAQRNIEEAKKRLKLPTAVVPVAGKAAARGFFTHTPLMTKGMVATPSLAPGEASQFMQQAMEKAKRRAELSAKIAARLPGAIGDVTIKPKPIAIDTKGRPVDKTSGQPLAMIGRQPTLEANLRALDEKGSSGLSTAAKEAVPAVSPSPDSEPARYIDPRVSVKGPQRHRRQFKWGEKGEYEALANRERAKAKLDKLQTEISMASKKTGISSAVKLAMVAPKTDIALTEVPDTEWWDSYLFPEGQSYESLGDEEEETRGEEESLLSLPLATIKLISNLVEHPIQLKPPTEPTQTQFLKVYLTKQEKKKIRRQNRREIQREQQEKIRLGLMAPPEPKVKLTNLMRVLGTDAIQDPTKMEAAVRAQMAARVKKHEQANSSRKLTKEQRSEKKARKIAEDTSLGVQVAVYRLLDLSKQAHKFKVEINAKQLQMTGIVILHKDVNVVVVEGGPKQQKFFKNLMLKRIKWEAPKVPLSSSSLLHAKQLQMTGIVILHKDVNVVVVEGGPKQQKFFKNLMLKRIKWEAPKVPLSSSSLLHAKQLQMTGIVILHKDVNVVVVEGGPKQQKFFKNLMLKRIKWEAPKVPLSSSSLLHAKQLQMTGIVILHKDVNVVVVEGGPKQQKFFKNLMLKRIKWEAPKVPLSSSSLLHAKQLQMTGIVILHKDVNVVVVEGGPKQQKFFKNLMLKRIKWEAPKVPLSSSSLLHAKQLQMTGIVILHKDVNVVVVEGGPKQQKFFKNLMLKRIKWEAPKVPLSSSSLLHAKQLQMTGIVILHKDVNVVVVEGGPKQQKFFKNLMLKRIKWEAPKVPLSSSSLLHAKQLQMTGIVILHKDVNVVVVEGGPKEQKFFKNLMLKRIKWEAPKVPLSSSSLLHAKQLQMTGIVILHKDVNVVVVEGGPKQQKFFKNLMLKRIKWEAPKVPLSSSSLLHAKQLQMTGIVILQKDVNVVVVEGGPKQQKFFKNLMLKRIKWEAPKVPLSSSSLLHAKQLQMTGIVILHKDVNVVVVEGGPKQQKFFKNLMLKRIKWEAPKKDGETSGAVSTEGAPVVLVWEGMVKHRSFAEIRFKACPLERQARELFVRFGVPQYWDMAYNGSILSQDMDNIL